MCLAALGSCGPQYKQISRVATPSNEVQAGCAGNCDQLGVMCAKMCRDNQARCFDLQKFSTRGGYNYNRNDLFNSNYFYNCDFVLEGCMRDCAKNKLLCFEKCGLKITQQEICIENCHE